MPQSTVLSHLCDHWLFWGCRPAVFSSNVAQLQGRTAHSVIATLKRGFRLEPGAFAGPKMQDIQFFFFLCQNATCEACSSERPKPLNLAPGVQEEAFQDPEPRVKSVSGVSPNLTKSLACPGVDTWVLRCIQEMCHTWECALDL